MEMLDIVDEKGNPIGQIIEREKAHEQGVRHRTSHVWLVRKMNHHIQILLQKRSDNKDSYPGCYDISSAGHIPAGVDFVTSALRELEEELGVKVDEKDLLFCGQRHFEFKEVFHGKFFCDNQISNVYLLWINQEENDFVLQKEEVSEVKWFDFEDCINKVVNNEIKHCIYMEELEMINKKIKEDER